MQALNPETEFQFKNRSRWDSVNWEEKFEGSSLGGVPASSSHKSASGGQVSSDLLHFVLCTSQVTEI